MLLQGSGKNLKMLALDLRNGERVDGGSQRILDVGAV